MKKVIVQNPEMKLIGITVRTSNQNEMNPQTALIPKTIEKYFSQGLAAKIPNCRNQGITYCAYSDYESDVNGEYTYFIGEEVSGFEGTPQELTALTIPSQSYVKMTDGPGQMPQVCIGMWQKIWTMSDDELGGKRSYIVDFELYDQRALDPANTELDIFIGIKEQVA